jgi:rubrerythrin
MHKSLQEKEGKDAVVHPELFQRRSFLLKAGLATASAAVLFTGCSPDMIESSTDVASNPAGARTAATNVDLGTGDVAVLNYAYLLEQLEAAFYIQAASSQRFLDRLTASDRRFFLDVRNHEIVHRDFFKAALGANAIPEVSFNFSSINFVNRNQVLATAKTLEDIGVAAYNGAGRFLQSAAFLTLAGKIVSVEARHAAYFREILGYYDRSVLDATAFAGDDIIDENGLDLAYTPTQVIALAAPFINGEVKFDALA